MYLFESSHKTNLSVFHYVTYIYHFITLQERKFAPALFLALSLCVRATCFRRWEEKKKNPCTYHLVCQLTMGIWKSILVEEIDKTVNKIWREEMMRQESWSVLQRKERKEVKVTPAGRENAGWGCWVKRWVFSVSPVIPMLCLSVAHD